MSQTKVFYTMEEWSVFETEPSTMVKTSQLRLVQFQNVYFTKYMVETFLHQIFLDSEFLKPYTSETSLTVKTQQLRAMKNFLGIEVGEIHVVNDEKSDTSYLAVRFSDGEYLGVQFVLNNPVYLSGGSFYGILEISNLPVEEIPAFQPLPRPSSPDARMAFSEHLSDRLDFVRNQHTQLSHSDKIVHELSRDLAAVEVSTLLKLQSDWEAVQSGKMMLNEFITSIRDWQEHCSQSSGELYDPYCFDPLMLEYEQKADTLRWVLSYFEEC